MLTDMRFSGLNTSNFAQAGRAASRDFEKSLDVARTYSPKSDEQVIAASNIRTKEKMAALKIKGEVTARGIRAAGSVESTKRKIDGEMSYKKSRRKAGVLAAGGKLIGDAGDMLGADPRSKRTVGEGSEQLTAAEKKAREQAEKWRNKNDDLTSVTPATDSDTTPEPGSTSDTDGVPETPSYTPPKPGKVYNQQELEQLAVQGGFSADDAPLVAKIAMGESSGNPMAFNGKGADKSYGIMQINMLGDMGPERRAQFGLKSNEELYDPLTNMKAAYKIYQQQGWGAWGAYTNGSYKNF